MELTWTWIPTTRETYSAIYETHLVDFVVFATFSNPEQHPDFGEPVMMTEWGFKGAVAPLIKSEHDPTNNRSSKYWIVKIEED